MMQGDVNTLTADTIKVLGPKKSPAFWALGVGISDLIFWLLQTSNMSYIDPMIYC